MGGSIAGRPAKLEEGDNFIVIIVREFGLPGITNEIRGDGDASLKIVWEPSCQDLVIDGHMEGGYVISLRRGVWP